MRSFKTEYSTNYSQQQIFELVADIEKYPEFMPWCENVRIREKTVDYIIADVVIKFAGIREKYCCKINFEPFTKIEVNLISGPFTKLENIWEFIDQGEKRLVKFEIDFQFKSTILEKLIGLFFSNAVKKLTEAFIKRAEKIY